MFDVSKKVKFSPQARVEQHEAMVVKMAMTVRVQRLNKLKSKDDGC